MKHTKVCRVCGSVNDVKENDTKYKCYVCRQTNYLIDSEQAIVDNSTGPVIDLVPSSNFVDWGKKNIKPHSIYSKPIDSKPNALTKLFEKISY